MNPFKLFKQVLRNSDIFGYPIILFINKDNNYKSKFGGLFSLILILTLTVIYWDTTLSYVNKESVSQTFNLDFAQSPSQVTLDANNFMFAISLDQSSTSYIYNQIQFFNVSVIYSIATRDGTGKQIKKNQRIIMEPCQLSKFQNIFQKYGQDFTDQYKNIGFDNWLCPKDNFGFNLSGIFTSNVFEYVKITISDCKNDTDPGVICAPNDVVLEQGRQTISIYTTSYILNVDKPQNYITPYLSDELFFTFKPESIYKSVNIFFEEFNILTDEDIFIGTAIKEENIVCKQQKDFQESIEPPKNNLYSTFYFRRSYFTKTVNRQFFKFIDFISYLGGFIGLLVPLFGTFISIYNKFDFIIYMANKLYNFDTQNKQYLKMQPQSNPIRMKNKKGKGKRGLQQIIDQSASSASILKIDDSHTLNHKHSSKTIAFVPIQDLDQRNLEPQDKNIVIINQEVDHETPIKKETNIKKPKRGLLRQIIKKQYSFILKEKFLRFFQDNKQIRLNFIWFIHLITFGMIKKTNTPYVQLVEKAIEKITFDLDIINIVKKNQEFEKLKNIIFLEEQITLFNVQPKQVLKCDDDQILDLDSLRKIDSKGSKIQPNLIKLQDPYEKIGEAYRWCLRKYPYQLKQLINDNLIKSLRDQPDTSNG